MFSHYIRGPVRFLGKSGKVRQRSARPPPQNVSPSIRRGGACPSRQVSEWFRSTLRVSPLGRVSFPAMGKKPKDRRGRLTSPSETSSLRFQFVLPQSPVYGRYPYTFPQNFRRAKYGSGYDSSRATGPWCGAKFWPVPFYRRAWFRPAVAEGAGSEVRRTRPFRKPAGGASPSPTDFQKNPGGTGGQTAAGEIP